MDDHNSVHSTCPGLNVQHFQCWTWHNLKVKDIFQAAVDLYVQDDFFQLSFSVSIVNSIFTSLAVD